MPLCVPQIWALAAGRKTEMLATGGTDAVLNLWHDCTMEDKQEDFRKKASGTTCCVFGIYLCQQCAITSCWIRYNVWKKNSEIPD